MRKYWIIAVLLLVAVAAAYAQDDTPSPREAIVASLTAQAEQQPMTATPAPEETLTSREAIEATATALASDLNIPDSSADLVPGDSVSDQLSPDVPEDVYTFEGEAGEQITVEMTSSTLDSYLQILDANGEVLITDDDGGGDRNARISRYTLPQTASYSVIATTFENAVLGTFGDTGAYVLDFNISEGQSLAYGEMLSGVLESEAQFFPLQASAGDTILVTFSADVGSPYISVNDRDLQIAYRGYYGEPVIIGPLSLTEAGLYEIEVGDFSEEPRINFDLTVERLESEFIAFGEPAEIDGDGYLAFDPGAETVIDLTFSDSITSYTLYDPSGFELIVGSGGDPISRYLLNWDGAYTLEVVGSGTVLLEASDLLSLDDGPQELSLDFDRYVDYLHFEGVADETIRFSVSTTTEIPGELNLEMMQDGEFLGYFAADPAEGFSFEFTPEASGEVMVIVYYYGDAATFELDLERVAE